jgi:FMN phosphatase YigB (HAD superfamily)
VPFKKEIKNIIFDLGGVILNLDIDRTYQQFSLLSGKSEEVLKLQASKVTFFNDYERGFIDDHSFRRHLKSFLEINVPEVVMDAAWNAMLLDLPQSRLALLGRVNQRFRIFLLSNTNNIHLQAFKVIAKSVMEQGSFDRYFENAYYSHLINMRKPDHEIYQYVLQANGLQADETLFLDDNLTNLQGAADIGIQTFHVQQPEMIFSLFNETKL